MPPRLAGELGRETAVEVVEVVEGSPAAEAGLRPEDLVLALAGHDVTGVDDVQRLLTGDLIGSRVEATVARGDRTLTVELVPSELAV